MHHEAQGYYPYGGWGWQWFGEADRGFGLGQPGGWIYNLMPYFEQSTLHDMNRGLSGSTLNSTNTSIAVIPVQTLYCPSRRPAATSPSFYFQINFTANTTAAKTDYAANSGDTVVQNYTGPSTYYTAAQLSTAGSAFTNQTGVIFLGNRIQAAHVTDGLSNTYAVGEKYLTPDSYYNGGSQGDNNAIYDGHDWDHTRWAYPSDSSYNPREDQPGYETSNAFGRRTRVPGTLYSAMVRCGRWHTRLM